MQFKEDGQTFKISMVGRGLDDAEMGEWAAWFQGYMRPWQWEEGFVAQEVDFSRNKLTAAGVGKLLDALWASGCSVRVLKLHHNELQGCTEIAGLLKEGTLREAHLSHNFLDTDSAVELVFAAAMAWDAERECYCYPRESKGAGAGSATPIWLRMEQNCIDYSAFEWRLKQKVRKAGRRDQPLCYVDGTQGCTPHACMKCRATPIAHIPYMVSQRQNGVATW